MRHLALSTGTVVAPLTRAVDPHSFLADPDPAAILMQIRIRIQFNKICNKWPYEEFSGVEEEKKIAQKYKTKEPIRIYFQ